jgi:hypothetical protein
LTRNHGCQLLQILTAHPEEKVKALLQPWQLFLLILAADPSIGQGARQPRCVGFSPQYRPK